MTDAATDERSGSESADSGLGDTALEGSDPEHPEPPDPPEGYREPTTFSYPTPWLLVGSFALLVGAAAGFGALMAEIRGVTSLEISFGPNGIAVVALLVVGTVVVHELIHGLVSRALGYRVRYGLALNMGAAYAAAFGQFQTRRDNLLIALAPVVVFTVVLVPLLAGPLRIALAAFLVLVVNTSGAVGDLYLAYRLARMPEGTLLYDADLRHSYVYVPE
ncbi:metalloprotease family protein [Halorussus amylolyticus]|uniref:metalloprotease family protein n=1 Tax=Halorussus amylolyticus TaxID=1126242 RepID=UPI001049F8E7|nr:metalloprotease family protein [Halorussus amylolyticus]